MVKSTMAPEISPIPIKRLLYFKSCGVLWEVFSNTLFYKNNILFIRVLRLKFVKLLEHFKNKPKAEILKRI